MRTKDMREQSVRAIILAQIGSARMIAPFLVGYIVMLTGGVILFVTAFAPFLLQNGKEPTASAAELSRPEARALVIAVVVPFMIILPAVVFGTLYSRRLFYRVLLRVLEAAKCFEAPSREPDESAPQTRDPPA